MPFNGVLERFRRRSSRGLRERLERGDMERERDRPRPRWPGEGLLRRDSRGVSRGERERRCWSVRTLCSFWGELDFYYPGIAIAICIARIICEHWRGIRMMSEKGRIPSAIGWVVQCALSGLLSKRITVGEKKKRAGKGANFRGTMQNIFA